MVRHPHGEGVRLLGSGGLCGVNGWEGVLEGMKGCMLGKRVRGWGVGVWWSRVVGEVGKG